MGSSRPRRRGVGALRCALAVAAAIAVAGAVACGDDEEDGATGLEPASGWTQPNADLRNTRWVEGEIDSSNVDELGVAWSVPIEAKGGVYGTYASNPVVVDGVVYSQDLDSTVTAIDLESGEVLWTKKYDRPDNGPNGVTVADGKVFGAAQPFAFALDAETGEELWSRRLPRNENEGIDMAPGYNDGTVYVSTNPTTFESSYAGNGQSILWAMDGETGEPKWKWEQVPDDLWGNKKENSGGGQWYPPAFDEEGDVYVAVANPAPFPITRHEHRDRPGENLYTNSCVKLDKETGEIEWYYQAVPNDPYDWDLQSGPILAESADGEPVVLCAGKMGYVYGIDQESGELLWKTPVGKHNGHDEDWRLTLEERYDELPKPPFKLYPGILGGVETQMAVKDSTVFVPVNNLPSTITRDEMLGEDPAKGTGEMVALDVGTGEVKWKHEFDSSPYGAAAVVNDLVFTTTFDGTVWALNTETGEVEWEQELPAGTNAPVTIEGDTVIAGAGYPSGKGERPELVAYRLGATGEAGGGAGDQQAGGGGGGGGGEGAADGAQVFTENCASCHALAAADASGSVGPNLDQLRPNARETEEQVRNGGGGMPAFGGRLSDAEIRAVAEYVASNAGG